jgi:hypothetical protein
MTGKIAPKIPAPTPSSVLHTDQPEGIIRKRVKNAAKRQDEEGSEEERLAPPFVRARSDQHRHRHHNNLGRHNADRHETCSEICVLERQLLADQRQHRRVGEMEKHHSDSEDQERLAGHEHCQAAGRVARATRTRSAGASVMQAAGKVMIYGPSGYRNHARHARNRHGGQEIKDDGGSPEIRHGPGGGGRAGVARVIECLIPSDTTRENAVPENT